MKIIFNLRLVPLDRKYIETVRQWRNDYRIFRWCRQNDFISDIQQAFWFDRQAVDPTIAMYGVQMRVEDQAELVGVAGFTSIDHLNRRAEFSLYIAPEKHGKGLGRQALVLLLDHGFKNLGFQTIWGESLAGNPAMKTFLKTGFQPEGNRRQFYFKDGAFHDAHLFSITREEWDAKLAGARSNVDNPSGPQPAGDIPGPADTKKVAADGGDKNGGSVIEAEFSEAKKEKGHSKQRREPVAT